MRAKKFRKILNAAILRFFPAARLFMFALKEEKVSNEKLMI